MPIAASSAGLQGYIEEVIRVSRGMIEAVLIAKPDGTPVVHANSLNINPDYLAAAVSAVSGVILSVLEVMEMGEMRRVDVELSDKRHVFIVPYKSDYAALITKPDPNLGLIDILVDLYFSEK